jgi:hypothetical protein
MNEPHQHKRSLGVRDMTLFTVSAILLLDTLAASASIGVSSIPVLHSLRAHQRRTRHDLP